MIAPYQSERISQKAHLANWLCHQLRASNYLEIATTSTGFQFGLVSRKLFSTVHRALYRLPADFNDGHPVHYPSRAADARECKTALLAAGHRYDIVFVDSWHTYDSSILDLDLAFSLLNPGGVIVVHDCYPVRREICPPEPTDGEWMGVSYIAFLDWLRAHPEMDYCVADMDYGCGIIWRRKEGASAMPGRHLLDVCNYRDWDVYYANRKTLLNLLSVRATLDLLRTRPSTRLTAALLRPIHAVLDAPAMIAAMITSRPGTQKAVRITKRISRRIFGRSSS